ncbi:MAG: hypothetical protein B0A82_09275 [Alkalinema sp. CACIAM 70d]|nr:MAG: hypothetical protein B0A82_09275 [Alkalinema sp. CACIAM 70d]
MTKGFGQPKVTKKPPSEAAKKRTEAAKQMDEMKAKGMPEFEIYIRIRDKKPWYPVGAISVQRSNQINQAIYANEEGLLQGAFRLFPILKKNAQNLEYGYRLKDYRDEEIQLAVKPASIVPNALQNAVANVGATIGGLFKKKSV